MLLKTGCGNRLSKAFDFTLHWTWFVGLKYNNNNNNNLSCFRKRIERFFISWIFNPNARYERFYKSCCLWNDNNSVVAALVVNVVADVVVNVVDVFVIDEALLVVLGGAAVDVVVYGVVHEVVVVVVVVVIVVDLWGFFDPDWIHQRLTLEAARIGATCFKLTTTTRARFLHTFSHGSNINDVTSTGHEIRSHN